MPKRRKWTFAVLAGVLVVGAIWFAWSDPQPSHLGKSLAYWIILQNNDSDDAVRDQPHYEEAIRRMDTNCLPYLLNWIAYEPPAWKTKLVDFLVLKGPQWIPERFQEDRAQRLAEGAFDAFRILGRRASPAIPQLARLARDTSRGVSADRAANVLTLFGPQALPFILDLLNHPRPFVRSQAILGVAHSGTNAMPAIPRLIECLKDPDENFAAMAARALGELQLRPELSVPALTNALQEDRFELAVAARTALGKFGLVFPAVRGSQNFRYGIGPDGP